MTNSRNSGRVLHLGGVLQCPARGLVVHEYVGRRSALVAQPGLVGQAGCLADALCHLWPHPVVPFRCRCWVRGGHILQFPHT